MFSKDWLRVIEIIPVRYESANGVVLTGDATRLARCFRRYVKSETSAIHRIIERNVGTIAVSLLIVESDWAVGLLAPCLVYRVLRICDN